MQSKKTGSFWSIAFHLIFTTSAMFLITTGIIVIISYNMYKEAFYRYSTELCTSTNALAAHVIDGDLVEYYGKTLTVDERYAEFAENLDKLKVASKAKYLYILVDKGDPDTYTFIYDATHEEEFPGEKYALGSKDVRTEYEGADEVMVSGKAFKQAFYYNDVYGELYYAYAPIFNSQGKVVAFLGTDVDITPLHVHMIEYRNKIIFALIAAFVFFFVLNLFVTRRLFTIPMKYVTGSALDISQGILTLHLPEKLLKRRDEIGLLGSAFESVSTSIKKLTSDIEDIMRSVRHGQFKNRANSSSYKGDYYRIITGVNQTIDVVCRHFDAFPEAIAFISANGNVLYANKSMLDFSKLHGFDTDSDDFFQSILKLSDDGKLKENAEKILSGQDCQPYATDIYIDDKTYTLGFLCNQNNTAGTSNFSMMMMLTDITVLMNTIKDLELASRAKSDFLSRMSHEIRTPMNAIIGMTQIAENSNDQNKIQNCLFQISQSSAHLLSIINDILDLSKIEAGKMTLSEEEFSLTENIHNVISMIQAKAREKNININLEVKKIEHDTIITDSTRLNQVFLNLLSNAVKFSHDDSSIDFSVEETNRYDGYSTFRFVIKDYGIGIEKDKAQKLFKPFEQADTSVSRTYGGTGLGLAISKNIIEMMSGYISLESDIGQGSTFSFIIKVPASNTAINRTQNSIKISTSNMDGKNLLLVDDIEINREIIVEFLKDTGAVIETATNGQEAVEKFAASPLYHYSFILMDMQMPVMDGCEATEIIRGLDRPDSEKVTIIAMTANVLKEDVDRALASGMNGHIGKPIDINALFTILDGFSKDRSL